MVSGHIPKAATVSNRSLDVVRATAARSWGNAGMSKSYRMLHYLILSLLLELQ